MAADHERRYGANLERVTLKLEETDWHGHATETMWACPLGEDRYQIRNVPFYAYGLSYDDVVETKTSGEHTLVGAVVKRGGHSTYRIFVTKGEALKRFEEFWRPLEQAECTVERATERLFAVDVPPESDIIDVYQMLEAGADASVWDFEEGHVGHTLRAD